MTPLDLELRTYEEISAALNDLWYDLKPGEPEVAEKVYEDFVRYQAKVIQLRRNRAAAIPSRTHRAVSDEPMDTAATSRRQLFKEG
jgi:hypothetical protein